MIGKEFFTQKKTPVIIVLLLLIAGSLIYFTLSPKDNSGNSGSMASVSSKSAASTAISASTLNLLKDVQLKAAYTEEGNIDVFALAKNNAMAKIGASQGNSIPEVGGVVIGNVEGSMMQEEGEFKNVGDNIVDYNITLRIDGVLANTGTFADDFHFLSSDKYDVMNGGSGVLLVKFKDANTPKLFYLYDKDNPSPAKIELSDGNVNLFYVHIINKKIYYPIILGSQEAKMMQEEKIFAKTGDTIDGFFGKDVMIAGIAKETNTSLDMMHVVEKDFFDEPTRGVLV